MKHTQRVALTGRANTYYINLVCFLFIQKSQHGQILRTLEGHNQAKTDRLHVYQNLITTMEVRPVQRRIYSEFVLEEMRTQERQSELKHYRRAQIISSKIQCHLPCLKEAIQYIVCPDWWKLTIDVCRNQKNRFRPDPTQCRTSRGRKSTSIGY